MAFMSRDGVCGSGGAATEGFGVWGGEGTVGGR